MTEKHETKIISRRSAFGILGLGALSLVVAPTVLTVSYHFHTGLNRNRASAFAPKEGLAIAPEV